MKKNILKAIIAIVVIVLVMVIIYFFTSVTHDKNEEEILRNEINELSKKDLTKDSFDTEIKSTGDYAIVEKTIKSYLNEYAKNVQSVLKIIENKKFKELLTSANYQKDGPEFKESYQYISDTEDSLTSSLDRLKEMSDEKYIMKLIEDQNLDKYYNDLYKELMFNGINKIDLKSSREQLTASSEEITNLLDKEKEVLDLLSKNAGKWSIQNDRIIFNDTNTLNEYNNLVGKLNQ